MLSVTVTYALRALIELSRVQPECAMSGRELADRTAIPRNYLSKVLGALRSARLLSAVRGIGGGYRLSEDPSRIRIADVVRLFEGPTLGPRCVLQGDRSCSGREPCAAHDLWSEVGERYTNFLEKTTVAALAGGPGGWRPETPARGPRSAARRQAPAGAETGSPRTSSAAPAARRRRANRTNGDPR
jgi:Rrf2 family iron-sulfur cluster assembly transcriptional regulator